MTIAVITNEPPITTTVATVLAAMILSPTRARVRGSECEEGK